MQLNEQPIGVFDSGIGGLTVAKAIRQVLPHESLLYFGDTIHLPYGDKSSQAIQKFSKQIARFLSKKHCKMIVIACNTASSLAYETVKKACPEIDIINVIDPVIDQVLKPHSVVGVIGTKATIQSGIYAQKINQKDSSITVKSLATPLLANLIEEGFIKDNISQVIIRNYLRKEELKDIQQLILACTHYPLIQNSIASYYDHQVGIIDSASEVAKYVKQLLEQKNRLSQKNTITDHFFISNYTKSFEQSAKFFFGENITLEEVTLNF